MTLGFSVSAAALVPTISTLALLEFDGAENASLRSMLSRESSDTLRGRKIAVLVADGVEEIEVSFPLHVLRALGAGVELIAPREGPTLAKLGLSSPPQRNSHILTVRFMENSGWLRFDRTIEDAKAADYDAVYVPGGAWSPDTLRINLHALEFLRTAQAAGKLIASICHGPQVLINAGILKSKRATGYWAIHADLSNAGVQVQDVPVVVDGNLITSRYPLDLPEFIDAIEKHLRR